MQLQIARMQYYLQKLLQISRKLGPDFLQGNSRFPILFILDWCMWSNRCWKILTVSCLVPNSRIVRWKVDHRWNRYPDPGFERSEEKLVNNSTGMFSLLLKWIFWFQSRSWILGIFFLLARCSNASFENLEFSWIDLKLS